MARAVRFDQYGGIEVLYVADVDVPAPARGEVLVAVRAASVNPGESAMRQGYLADLYPASFPSGQGSDLAGVVTQTGEESGTFAPGDEVLGWTDARTSHAQYVSVPVDHLIHKPANLSWEAAGSLYVVGATAYAAVRAVGAGPGDTVGVSGAAGGVGSVVVQLLRVRGAEVVGIASPANHAWLRAKGATPVEYGPGLAQRVREAAPSGLDAFIDTFGKDYLELAIDLGVAPERIDTIIAFEAAGRLGTKTEGSSAAASADVLSELAELVSSGRVEIPVAATYPLDRVREAYEELERRHTHGKIVLLP
ncbi:NADP-dependent oxidoreductase [Rugosimonospora acidiphila]|uniref:NADP-dependent oxidoreductase n=1 Tax=Rugosimonospora acidiphila TaxID=556531 RepID=A0ABP9SNH3_9ACTN